MAQTRIIINVIVFDHIDNIPVNYYMATVIYSIDFDKLLTSRQDDFDTLATDQPVPSTYHVYMVILTASPQAETGADMRYIIMLFRSVMQMPPNIEPQAIFNIRDLMDLQKPYRWKAPRRNIFQWLAGSKPNTGYSFVVPDTVYKYSLYKSLH